MSRRAVLGIVVATTFAATAATATSLAARRSPADVRNTAAASSRIRVQVLNATQTRGLARRAMLYLRDQGFDVVELGTASPTRDTSLVLDRSGHADYAKQVAAAMGGARVEARADSSRYLDVTVLIGRSWRAPAQPFYP
jgi:hypothetical protein